MFRFESLDIWKLAIEYCDKVFDIVDDFPQKAQYNLGEHLESLYENKLYALRPLP